MKKNNIQSFIRRDLQDWESYIPGDSAWELAKRFNVSVDDLIKLNANENPYGPSPLARKAIANQKWYNYYPGGNYTTLRETIAKYRSVTKEQIVVGAGLDEIIDLLLRVVINDGDEIINCPPTFGMYATYAKLNRAKTINITRKSDFSLDITAIKNAVNDNTKMIVICNPNNPTGTLTPLSEIETLLKTKKLLLVDEAYYAFSKKTAMLLMKKYNNLIILRTFSKWAGLAGLRLGYAMLDPILAQKITAIKSPFNVNLAAQTAAIATLSDTTFAKITIKKITAERERVYKELQTYKNMHVFPSKGNFLFIRLLNDTYPQLKLLFEKNKCAVRFYDSRLSNQGIRITIGKPSQNDVVVKVLKEFTYE